MQTRFLISSLIAGFATTAFSAVTITTVALLGGSSAVGAFTMASCYGQHAACGDCERRVDDGPEAQVSTDWSCSACEI